MVPLDEAVAHSLSINNVEEDARVALVDLSDEIIKSNYLFAWGKFLPDKRTVFL